MSLYPVPALGPVPAPVPALGPVPGCRLLWPVFFLSLLFLSPASRAFAQDLGGFGIEVDTGALDAGSWSPQEYALPEGSQAAYTPQEEIPDATVPSEAIDEQPALSIQDFPLDSGTDFFSLPDSFYEAPVYETPSTEIPFYEAPSYEAPVYEAPVYETPSYEIPSGQSQAYEAPSSLISYQDSSSLLSNGAPSAIPGPSASFEALTSSGTLDSSLLENTPFPADEQTPARDLPVLLPLKDYPAFFVKAPGSLHILSCRIDGKEVPVTWRGSLLIGSRTFPSRPPLQQEGPHTFSLAFLYEGQLCLYRYTCPWDSLR